MRGRKPTPRALKLLRGNPGKRPINQAEPQPGALAVRCPTELVDRVARREWTRAIVPAIAIGQITAADRVMAIAHCELWATWRSQLADACRHAHVIAVGEQHYPTPNPARMMSNKTFVLLARVDTELGFTPSSRSRVQVVTTSTPTEQRERFFGSHAGRPPA
jgi:P27 family predicted phage terminase small subunit